MGAGLKEALEPAPPHESEAQLAAVGLGIRVGFSTTGALLSRIIRWAIRAPVSHCFVTFNSPAVGQVLLIEASRYGLRIVPYRRWRAGGEEQHIAIYRIQISEDHLQRALTALIDRLGDAYDRLGLVGYFLVMLFHLKKNPLDDKEKLVCSEAVGVFLEACGLKVPPSGIVTPRHLFDLVHEKSELFVLEDGDGRRYRWAVRSAERRIRRRKSRRRRAAAHR